MENNIKNKNNKINNTNNKENLCLEKIDVKRGGPDWHN